MLTEPPTPVEYFHGSPIEGLNEVAPTPNGMLSGAAGVLATHDRDTALTKSLPWESTDFAHGIVEGQPFMQEKYPGAFAAKLRGKSYLYSLGDSGFSKNDRLAHNEVMSQAPAPVLKTEEIPDVWEAIKATKYLLLPHGEKAPWDSPGAKVPYKESFQKWKLNGNEADLHATVKGLQPAIAGALRSMGVTDDAATTLKARILATKAVKTYDPASGAGLPTWVTQQLQPIRRFRRLERSTVKIPEGVQLDALHVSKSERDFLEKYHREPDVEELADFSKLSIARIASIRTKFRKVVSQGAIGDAATFHSNDETTDHSDEALGYVYRDADKVDRAIIEMKTGYGGKYEPMSPVAISQKLGLSPVQLSRRSAKLSFKVDELRGAIGNIS